LYGNFGWQRLAGNLNCVLAAAGYNLWIIFGALAKINPVILERKSFEKK
jgi:hypothetical protein